MRAEGGVINANGYGVLVGSEAGVREVLKDDGSKFSVCGYGKRMSNSIGLGYLGLDDVGSNSGHREQAPDVNQVIEKSISERTAFVSARKHAENYLTRLLQISQALTGRRLSPVHIVDFGRDVLSKLCTEWFGVPDNLLMLDARRADDRLNWAEKHVAPAISSRFRSTFFRRTRRAQWTSRPRGMASCCRCRRENAARRWPAY